MSSIIIGRRQNLRKLLERKAERYGDKPFIIFVDAQENEEILTYNSFNDLVDRFANWLLSMGIKKGDFIMVHLPNSPGFCIAWMATSKIGAIMIPSIIFDVAEDMEYKMNFSGAKMLVTDGNYYPMFESIWDKCPTLKDIVIYRGEAPSGKTHSWNEILAKSLPSVPPIEVDSFDPSTMLFTSGTTARPKGVILTHANSLFIGESCARNYFVTPEDRHMLVLPLFHVNAQYISWMPTLTVGASIVICERFSAAHYMPLVRKYNCTIGSLVSTTVRTILAQPPSPLDRENPMWRCPYGIAITDEEWDEFERRFNTTLLDLYGLTETLAPCTMTPVWSERRRGSVGLPGFDIEIKIVDDERNEVPIGQTGEIAIKGTPGLSLMKEYYKNPKATQEALDGNNWFYSGDYGKMDEEGWVYFVDRKKDMIHRAAENVSAAEVERVIMEHGDVEEVAVIGVPDPIRDEAVMAVVRLIRGAKLTAEELQKYCKSRMAKFKVPEFVIFREHDFSKTSVGKIRKNIVRAEILEIWKHPKAK
jgi:crotonobetaine/carnitine-CoA ligase